MSERIDKLAQDFARGEQGAYGKGDTVTQRMGGGYLVYTAAKPGHTDMESRILERAPKPKPAWHDAVAVIATYDDHVDQETFRGVWTPDGDGIWQHEDGVVAGADALTDVTPLIEAKVTDEMVTRAHVEMLRLGLGDYSCGVLASIITAALGLETE